MVDDGVEITEVNTFQNKNSKRNGEIPLISKDNLNPNKYDKYMNCGWYDVSANRCFFHFNDGWN